MKPEDLLHRFTYHPAPDSATALKYAEIRTKGLELATLVDQHCPEGREKATAVTKIEEAVMWANAGIARGGPARFTAPTAPADPQPAAFANTTPPPADPAPVSAEPAAGTP